MPLLLLCVALIDDPAPRPEPLSSDQLARLQRVVRTSVAETKRLRGLLAEKQRALARHYGTFELDTAAVDGLQKEILDLQRDLLEQYHRMQVELRQIVGKERFVLLKQRIDRMLEVPEPPAPKKKESDR